MSEMQLETTIRLVVGGNNVRSPDARYRTSDDPMIHDSDVHEKLPDCYLLRPMKDG